MPRMKPVIHSIKHYVSHTRAATVTGTTLALVIVDAVSVSAVGAATNQVEEGSIVKAVYVENWYVADQDAMGSCTMILEKVPAGQDPATTTQMANLGAYPNKKNVLQVHQGLTPGQNQNPMPFFMNWYKIPKGKQRFGLGDRLVLSQVAVSGGMETCGFFTYKEYN